MSSQFAIIHDGFTTRRCRLSALLDVIADWDRRGYVYYAPRRGEYDLLEISQEVITSRKPTFTRVSDSHWEFRA